MFGDSIAVPEVSLKAHVQHFSWGLRDGDVVACGGKECVSSQYRSCSKDTRSPADVFRYRCSLMWWCRVPREVSRDVVLVINEFSVLTGNGRSSEGRGCTALSQVVENPLSLVV